MKFLVDRCAGHRLAAWLREQGHDVVEARDLGSDPGDEALLRLALAEARVTVTIDSDFGTLIYRDSVNHAGLVRLPDVPASDRVLLRAAVLASHTADLVSGAVVTVRGDRIRISK